jgi:SAM-dependent methyltransferase
MTVLIHAVEAATVRELVDFGPIESLLDIGAGGGRWTKEFSRSVDSVVSIEPSDIFQILTENVRDIPNVQCNKISFEQLSEDRCYDMIVVSGVLLQVVEDVDVDFFISKIGRILNPGGIVFLRDFVASRGKTMIDWKLYPSVTRPIPSKCRYWERLRPQSYYENLFQKNGLNIEFCVPSHAPFFQYLPSYLRVAQPYIGKLLQSIFSKDNLSFVLIYNRLVRRVYAKLQDTFSVRACRLFIFRKI